MFRHKEKLSRHGSVVRGILVLEQIAMKQQEPLFSTGYKDPPFPPAAAAAAAGAVGDDGDDGNDGDGDGDDDDISL